MSDIPTLPLLIGVTGHRDTPESDLPLLKSRVHDCLVCLQSEFPDTPLLILSGLAEGADRLVVEVAHDLGIAFAAVLPFPHEDYATDFETLDSRTAFYAWLNRAAWVHTLPATASLPTGLPAREAGYVQLGNYLATYSQALLALWDGDPQEKPGGTSQVVRLILKGHRHDDPLPAGLSVNLDRPVYHIPTRRMSRPAQSTAPNHGQMITLWPTDSEQEGAWLPRRWHDTIQRMAQFNRDANQFSSRQPASISDSRAYLLGQHFDEAELDPLGRVMANLFAVSDALSMRAQKRRRTHFVAVVILALIAVMAQQSYGFFLWWPLLMITLLSGLSSYAVYLRGRRLRLEEAYLDYRALAEGLRIQFFWHVSGVGQSVTDTFLRDQRDELEWIRQALQFTLMRADGHVRLQPFVWVMERWVKDQRNYFIGDCLDGRHGQATEEEANALQMTQWMKLAFFGGLALLATGAGLHEFRFDTLSPEWQTLLVNSILAAASCLMCVVPAVKLYADTMAFEEHAKRYLKMGRYFLACERRLTERRQDHSLKLARPILAEAGTQALIENGDWLLLHRQRPVRMPVM